MTQLTLPMVRSREVGLHFANVIYREARKLVGQRVRVTCCLQPGHPWHKYPAPDCRLHVRGTVHTVARVRLHAGDVEFAIVANKHTFWLQRGEFDEVG